MSPRSPAPTKARRRAATRVVSIISALALVACGEAGPTAPASVANKALISCARGGEANRPTRTLDIGEFVLESPTVQAQTTATPPCGLRPLFDAND